MKLRSDFVTNSSSSSYILAHNGKLNEKQKKAILQFVTNYFLGSKHASNEDEAKRFIKDNYVIDEHKEEILDSVNDGLGIYEGYVSFEGDDEVIDIYQTIWKILEENGDGKFKIIDGELEY